MHQALGRVRRGPLSHAWKRLWNGLLRQLEQSYRGLDLRRWYQ